jgi:hypothetical protein
MSDRTTHTVGIRVPRTLWAAYDRVCARLGTSRNDDLLEHIRGRVAEHGDDADRADLAEADAELAERRARKGGRPKTGPQRNQ